MRRQVQENWRFRLSRIIPVLDRYSRYVVYSLANKLKTIGQSEEQQQLLPRQGVLTWEVDWPFLADHLQLENWLKSKGVQFSAGGWTIYIPPQKRLSTILKEPNNFYPLSAGYKILKHFRPPDQARYCYRKTRDVRTLELRRMRGTVFDILIGGNYLFANNIGPRVWDLTQWNASGQAYTVLVVDHITGFSPNMIQYNKFIQKLRDLDVEDVLTILALEDIWEEHVDFRPPDCNGNLIVSKKTNELQYIDFQNMVVNAQLWMEKVLEDNEGTNRTISTNNLFVEQSHLRFEVVQQQSSDLSWTVFTNQLLELGISVRNRLVLSLNCRRETLLLFRSLQEGARWAFGWDFPQLVSQSEELLFSLGASRFTLFPGDIGGDYPIAQHIPEHISPYLEEAFVFCSIPDRHPNLLQCLAKLPWRVLIFEGCSGETTEMLEKVLEPLLKGETENCKLIPMLDDGFTNNQNIPIVILVR
jgi:hypothetical protein